MKKFVIYFFILLSINLFAQNNQLDLNAKWYVSTDNSQGQCVENYNFNDYFNGDTVINGNQYFKLNEYGYHYSSMKGQGSICPPNGYYTGNHNIALIRYHQKKLLTWSSITNQDEVFLDYNLVIGDTIKNVGYINNITPFIVITSIDSVLVNGVYLKRFYYYHQMGIKYIMEKIGSKQGFLNTYSYDFESGSLLNCYSENAITLYNEPSSTATCELTMSLNEKDNEDLTISLFPNPATNEFMIDSKNSHLTLNKMVIKNYLGQIIQTTNQPKTNFNFDISSLKSGMYFVELETEKGTVLKKIIKQ